MLELSEETIKALCQRLNESDAFRRAASREGAFLFRAGDLVVFVRLGPGECREARLGGDEAEADFVIEAEPEAFEALARGELDPVSAFTQGKLKLKKGSLFALLPYARAAKAIFEALS